jgi:hypothetical protein
MIISIVYFSPSQLLRSIWPSINMLKIIKYPYLERLEFIVVSVWMLVALTGLLLNTWAITRGFKRMWNWNQKTMLVIVSIITVALSLSFEAHSQIAQMNKWIGKWNVALSFVYPMLLSCIVAIVFAFRRRKASSKGEGSR